MLPVVRELAAEYADRIDFQVLDYYADSTKPLQSQYGMRGHPSFVILGRDGSPSPPLFGLLPRDQLVAQLEGVLA